ncbi:MAG TPA: aldo/keto reductase [Acidimicrobiales bacterium]|nr:aldo/keto reductase [Acidimicrobiales bacterium]
MKTVVLGKSGLEVSRIAFGTWQLGGDWGGYDEDRAVAAIRQAWDLGVTLFDTAQGYGMGRSEALLGRALDGPLRRERDRVVVATKGGIDPGGDRFRRGEPAFIRAGVDDSLRFLGVDRIDLYQIHWPDPAVPFEETAAEVAALVAEGKIGHVGVSNFDVAQMEAFSAVCPVETLQPPYNLLRRSVEDDILPYCRKQDIGVLAYSPLASGLLTGSVGPDTTYPADDWRSTAAAFTGDARRRNLAVVDGLKAVAADLGISLSQLAVAWVLAQPGVHVAIVGSGRPETIVDSAGAADVVLEPATLDRIEALLPPAG